jgi:hypothetical protein
MNVTDIGKCIYIWNTDTILGGDVGKIAASVREGGYQSAVLHSATLAGWRSPKRIALVDALKAVGVIPILGAAVYGYNVDYEAQLAATICKQYGLPVFVPDAEAQWDAQPHPDSNAAKLIKTFRANAPGVLVGWCWWARHKNPRTGAAWHPAKVLWAAMAKNYGDADFGLPMAYWEGESAANATKLVQETFAQWREQTDKPLIPIGRAYTGDNGIARPEAVRAFEAEARRLGAVGVAWWSMEHALGLPGIWAALAALRPFAEIVPVVEPPPALTLEQRVARIEQHLGLGA